MIQPNVLSITETMQEHWRYLSKGGAWLGPVSLDALHALMHSGELSPQSSVWQVGQVSWTRALTVWPRQQIEPEQTFVVVPAPPRASIWPKKNIEQAVQAPAPKEEQAAAVWAHPLRRGISRWTELLFFAFLFFIFSPFLVSYLAPVSLPVWLATYYLSFLGLAAFNSVSYFLFGNSLFKNLFHLKVRKDTGRKLSFLAFFLRECKVYFFGLGFLLPFPPFWAFCMWRHYQHSRQGAGTQYDKQEYPQTARPFSWFSWVLIALLVFVAFSFQVMLQAVLSLY